MHDIYIAFISFTLRFADTCTHSVPIFLIASMFDQQQSTQENVIISWPLILVQTTVDLIGCRTPLLHI